jgi:hypothetical protein
MDADEEYIRKSRLIQYVCLCVYERQRDTHKHITDDEDYEILRHPHCIVIPFGT